MSDFHDAYETGRLHGASRPALKWDRAVVLRDESGGEHIEYVDLERATGEPSAKRGHSQFFAVKSFARYYSDHKGPGSAIYVNHADLTVVAVFDGHAPDAPGWGRHRASLVTQLTRAWTDWMTFGKGMHGQVEFAHFIESHVTEIAEPDGASLLDMVTTLEVKRDVAFASAVKLQSGAVQFVYNETVEGTTHRGSAQMPDRLKLVMAPILSGPLKVVPAKLRYRLLQDKLTLGVELHRPLDVLEDAFDARLTDLLSHVGEDAVLYGVPPSTV